MDNGLSPCPDERLFQEMPHDIRERITRVIHLPKKLPKAGAILFNALETRIPPVALVFVFAALMWLLSAYTSFAIAVPWRSALAVIFGTVGFAIFAIAV